MDQELRDTLRNITERLKREYQAEKVILFGSHARGEAGEDSDIDLLVIARTNERFFERMATVRRIIRDLRKGLPVSPIVLTSGEVKKKEAAGDQFVQNILQTGTEL